MCTQLPREVFGITRMQDTHMAGRKLVERRVDNDYRFIRLYYSQQVKPPGAAIHQVGTGKSLFFKAGDDMDTGSFIVHQ